MSLKIVCLHLVGAFVFKTNNERTSRTAGAPLLYFCKCLCCVSVRGQIGSSWLRCAVASGANRCQLPRFKLTGVTF